MTDAGIPMGEGQRAEAVYNAALLAEAMSTGSASPGFARRSAIRAMLAFADTPPPAAAGDRALAEAAARIIDPDAWHETLPTDGCGAYWIGRRNEARTKADAILKALRTPEPDSGGEGHAAPIDPGPMPV